MLIELYYVNNVRYTLHNERYKLLLKGNTMAKNLRLKTARARLDMSQQDLADAVDVTRQTISAIERGDYNPSINLCIRICKALNVTLNDFFWEATDNEPI